MITCVDEGSRMFLVECVAKISEVWNGLKIKLVRKAKIKVFRNVPSDNILEKVDDTSGLLCDLILEEKDDEALQGRLIIYAPITC